jgi:aspartokinase-like uncharacterized kinase
MPPSIAVVKVGGSLYDLPDLGSRLRRWLAKQYTEGRVALVPGGGESADVIRHLDRCHGLGEETSHWLALRALTLNAHFLAQIVPSTCVGANVDEIQCAWEKNLLPILDVHEFARADEQRSDHLPHSWAVTSDAFAARLAVVLQAHHLVLLKSISIPRSLDWTDAGRLGFVDEKFAEVLRGAPADLRVSVVNLRKDEG